MSLVLFQTDQLDSSFSPVEGLQFELWKPSFSKVIPPGKGKKYLVYWLYHMLGIFSNNQYSAVLVYKDNRRVASLLVVPKYHKWKFMNREDVQFTYVMVDKDFRGQGLAKKMIQFGAESCKKGTGFWYVTDETNQPSIKTALNSGFTIHKG